MPTITIIKGNSSVFVVNSTGSCLVLFVLEVDRQPGEGSFEMFEFLYTLLFVIIIIIITKIVIIICRLLVQEV